jgi:hypothetical protein
MTRIVALFAAVGLLLAAVGTVFAGPQSHSAVPEVPAGSNPEPNGGGSNGNPSGSANPEVPAGQTPQPNG